MKKKIFTLLTLAVLGIASAWASEVATFNLGTKNGVSSPEGFFKSVGEKWNWNTKFTGGEYDGKSFSQGLKMEGTTKIGFTTTAVSTVTIVQSTWSSTSINLDDQVLDPASATAGTNCRIYTVSDVKAGDHVISRGSGSESGLFYVKVEWLATQTVTFTNDASWAAVFAYAWSGEGENTVKYAGDWPGTQLEANAEGDYVWSTTGSPTKIIFSDGGTNQTADLDFKDGGKYTKDGRTIELNDYTATFQTDGMTEVWAYVWKGEEKALGEWPGTKMEGSDGNFSITIKAEEAPANIIFHNNAGVQTPDWTFEDGKAYEYMLNTYTATFTTDAGWDKVYSWIWSGTGDKTKNLSTNAYPGDELEAVDGVYTFTYKAFTAPEYIQFNGGNGEKKTPDMGFTSGRAYKWNTTLTNPIYAPEASEETIPAGTTVDVKDAEGDVVATLTYGFEGGADFAAYIPRPNEEFAAFQNYTGGNGENGNATSGTAYIIKPVYDGSITVAVWLNGSKSFYIQEDGTSLAGFDGLRKDYGSSTGFTFNVKAGSTYKVYCTGSKLGFYGFDYQFDKPATVTIGSTGWATFSSNKIIDPSTVEGLSAYMVTGVNNNAIVLSDVIDQRVPANTGLLLNGTAETTYTIPTTKLDAALPTGDNLLIPGTGEKVGSKDNYMRYVLSEADGKAVFQCIWNEKDLNDVRPTVPVGKAFLEVPVSDGARTLYINGETTGINNVENAGQFTFGTVYNMNGQRVSLPTKGLYIMNGKKVVIK
jgi:hypothetical protein